MNWQYINKSIVEVLGWCFFINAAMFLPQMYALFHTKNSESISLLMWIFFVLVNGIMSLHCTIEKKYKMAIGALFSAIFSLIICGMILAYR